MRLATRAKCNSKCQAGLWQENYFFRKKIMICNNILEEGLSSFQNRYLYLKMFYYDVSITIIIMST